MSKQKYGLLSAEETAQILGKSLKEVYEICDFFDARDDDEWELIEGEHFEWLSKTRKTRRFYEKGAMVLAKYIQEVETANPIRGFIDAVIERITHRRQRTRKLLVRRRVVIASQEGEAIVRGKLVFLDRRQTIKILATNGKGLNYASRREQNNTALTGREPMEIGVHFDKIDDVDYFSQRGIARLAQNMSENLQQKSRRSWTDAVFEVVEDALEEQRKYLDSFDARVQRAMRKAKKEASGKCMATLDKQKPYDPFDLHAHHLFDKSTRPDLADFQENILVVRDEIHTGFHAWHGSEACEPQDFLNYLTSVESWRFEDKNQKKARKKSAHLHKLMIKLENLQRRFEDRYQVK